LESHILTARNTQNSKAVV